MHHHDHISAANNREKWATHAPKKSHYTLNKPWMHRAELDLHKSVPPRKKQTLAWYDASVNDVLSKKAWGCLPSTTANNGQGEAWSKSPTIISKNFGSSVLSFVTFCHNWDISNCLENVTYYDLESWNFWNSAKYHKLSRDDAFSPTKWIWLTHIVVVILPTDIKAKKWLLSKKTCNPY